MNVDISVSSQGAGQQKEKVIVPGRGSLTLGSIEAEGSVDVHQLRAKGH